MALARDGSQIFCDGEGCHALADAPVGLHRLVSGGRLLAQPIDGWLFAADGDVWRHYCPRCLASHLHALRERPIDTSQKETQ